MALLSTFFSRSSVALPVRLGTVSVDMAGIAQDQPGAQLGSPKAMLISGEASQPLGPLGDMGYSHVLGF